MILVSEHRAPLLRATHTAGTWTVTPTEGRDVPRAQGSGSTIPAAVVDYLTRAEDAETARAYPACAGVAVDTLRAAADKLSEVKAVNGTRRVIEAMRADLCARASLLAAVARDGYTDPGGAA